MIRMRLQRWGHKHRPYYRIVVTYIKRKRDGRFLEVVGGYNPLAHSAREKSAGIKRVFLNVDRIKYWIAVGAHPSDTDRLINMHRYELGRQLGEGAFGSVTQAELKDTHEQVAIKTLKEKCIDVTAMMALPEVKALRSVTHDHIVRCRELILDRRRNVHMVFDLSSGGNLEALTRRRTTPFSERQIRTIFHQLLLAVRHMHSQSFMHRDVKPENILLRSPDLDAEIHVKLGDLGLAKHVERLSRRPHTTYVSTRWYRSPEILLRMSDYGFPSDMWAVGAVMVELIRLGEPLFPGTDEGDQLARIVSLRGHPAAVGWKRGENTMRARGIRLPKVLPASLATVVPGASMPVLQLVSDLLELDPARRPSATDALAYPLFMKRLLDTPPLERRCKKRCVGSRGGVDGDGGGTARTSELPSRQWSVGSDDDETFAPVKHVSLQSGTSVGQELLGAHRNLHRSDCGERSLFRIPDFGESNGSEGDVEPETGFEGQECARTFNLRHKIATEAPENDA